MGFQARRKKQETENIIEGDITVEEINIAILQMAPGKSPGMDGLPQEFYSKFQHKLTPLLAHYNEVFLTGTFSTFSNTASIILLPKKDKDPLLCGSKRPLSILNCDIKILSKVLANRLERVIAKLVHPDQVGYIRQRHNSDNIRHLLNIKWAKRNSPSPTLTLSLDAEKGL
uniref:Reverse transcriptase domain-containing protein n=1 Tax=Labrus bergylta TaxID=56723 RepID=A0A3Q3EB60_9LABR